MKVELFYDFASTYSYPAAMTVEAIAAERGVEVVWRPFLLGPVFGAQGWNDSPFNLYPAKGAYMWRDVARVCAALRLPFVKPSVFPRNSVLAARVAWVGVDEGWVASFSRRVYSANFAEDRDIGDPQVIGAILRELGLDADAVLARAQSEAARPKLRAATAEAMARGVFGAPSFLVGNELFWGHDRLREAVAWAVSPSAP